MVKSGSNHCQVVTGTIKHLLLHQYDNTVLLLTCSSLIQTRVAQIHINGLILRKLNRLIFFSLSCCLVFYVTIGVIASARGVDRNIEY